MKTGLLVSGTQSECAEFLTNHVGHYVYVLRRPDGRPFYVGKGFGNRVFNHEVEARHPNDRRSNAHKLNVIRSIWRSGLSVRYEIDFVSSSEVEALEREALLISTLKRLHENGPLTNLHPGGGSLAGASPISKEKHASTLGGIPTDNPEREVLNRFVLGIAEMGSVVLKPVSQFTPRPTKAWPSRRIGPTIRNAAAIAASASANGILLAEGCNVPRRVVVEGVEGLVENGVSCAIVMSGMGNLVPAKLPADESFQLNAKQARMVIGFIGLQKSSDLGIAQPPPM